MTNLVLPILLVEANHHLYYTDALWDPREGHPYKKNGGCSSYVKGAKKWGRVVSLKRTTELLRYNMGAPISIKPEGDGGGGGRA